jgi:hypothetical protein
MPRKPPTASCDPSVPKVTFHALETNWGNTIYSFISPPPEEIRDELLARRGGRTLGAVSLDVPDDVDRRAEGQVPDAERCVDASDPSRFRVFRYRREVVGSSFLPAGTNWAAIRGTSNVRWVVVLDAGPGIATRVVGNTRGGGQIAGP